MFNIIILIFFGYYFYKNNVKNGKLKNFMRKSLPNVIRYLQNVVDRIDGKRYTSSNRYTHNSNHMSQDEARQILGIKNHNPSREDVLSAFKKLMLINHPDKGGSEYLAAKIIQAKQTLINE